MGFIPPLSYVKIYLRLADRPRIDLGQAIESTGALPLYLRQLLIFRLFF
jgi:hypothetical protein